MSDSALLFLIYLPVALSVVVTLIFFRTLSRRPLFFIAALLSLLGLQSFAAPLATFLFLSPASQEVMRPILFGAAIQLCIGIPFLWWLKRAFHKP